MQNVVAAAAPTEAPPRRPAVLLAVACAAQFVCVLDSSIVNVALPPMQEALGLSPTGLQWVVSSYTLTFAGFLLLGGRFGDLFGRKRAFVGGLLLFAVASLAAGLYGLEQQLQPSAPIQGEFEAPDELLLPCTLHAAIERLKRSDLARELFGKEFIDGYIATKTMELSSFFDEITPWERRILASQV